MLTSQHTAHTAHSPHSTQYQVATTGSGSGSDAAAFVSAARRASRATISSATPRETERGTQSISVTYDLIDSLFVSECQNQSRQKWQV